MKTKLRNFLTVLLVFCLLVGGVVLQVPHKASAEDTDVYQVNGKYSISNTKLTTKCALYTADKDFPKKTRVYKITPKTKIQIVMENKDYRKKTLTGKKREQMIKKLNKTNKTIQFKEKNGTLVFIWVL